MNYTYVAKPDSQGVTGVSARTAGNLQQAAAARATRMTGTPGMLDKASCTHEMRLRTANVLPLLDPFTSMTPRYIVSSLRTLLMPSEGLALQIHMTRYHGLPVKCACSGAPPRTLGRLLALWHNCMYKWQ